MKPGLLTSLFLKNPKSLVRQNKCPLHPYFRSVLVYFSRTQVHGSDVLSLNREESPRLNANGTVLAPILGQIEFIARQGISCPRIKKKQTGTSLTVQWLRFCASTAEGVGSILGWGTKILHTTGHSLKRK